ncbi:guanine deaminase [Martelella alba]|uniref:Guanine deaminase n=1 Tax=Martelella alba TaxID=2590451 RepID=A0A506UFC6_9HYPH|nr:guanine deaminase [Martelella alba]TPW31655.1 guanine deaminase [Martelella alba]
MTKTRLLRGRLLSFHRRPETLADTDAYFYEEDGGLLIQGGRILAAGPFETVRKEASGDPEIIDHRPYLIMPGFIDAHLHFPQMQVIGSYAANLLEWLNTYTFVEEQRFANEGHAARIATHFFDEMVRHGTTTPVAYCSVHKASADAYFAEAEKRGFLALGGKVMMDRNAPDALTDTAQKGYDETKQVIADWHGKGRNHVVISPRFAITSTPEQMEAAKTLAAEHPHLHIQTHLSENLAEIDFACSLYPEAVDYTDIYARYGLLGEKTLLGHAIHLSERERDAISEAGAVAVHCPTSNLFLGSGLFAFRECEDRVKPLRIAVATDVGGGSSYSMLQTMDEAYKVQQLRSQRLDPLTSFYYLTRGNAEALSLSDRIGALDPGFDADLVVLDAMATPAMALKHEVVSTLAEELFLLQTLGDDRAIAETYIAGEPAKSLL